MRPPKILRLPSHAQFTRILRWDQTAGSITALHKVYPYVDGLIGHPSQSRTGNLETAHLDECFLAQNPFFLETGELRGLRVPSRQWAYEMYGNEMYGLMRCTA